MKKIFFMMLLFIINISAEENNKGKISLTFNGEKIEIPIVSVILRKDDEIIVSVRAERNNDNIQQMISMDLHYKNWLPYSEKDPYPYPNDLQLSISNSHKIEGQKGSREEFRYDLLKELVYYSKECDDEKKSWEVKYFNMQMVGTKLNFKDNSLVISCERMDFRSKTDKLTNEKDTFVNIKDFKFEIVI